MGEQFPPVYRQVIDALIEMCQHGQGQITARWTRSGVWNPNATPDEMPLDHRMNLLLARLSADERDALAAMLAQEVVGGVFETLKAPEGHGIEPFTDVYAGSPWQDFMGRLIGWQWPNEP